jgi:hypothetical protein
LWLSPDGPNWKIANMPAARFRYARVVSDRDTWNGEPVFAPRSPEQIICAILRGEASDWDGGSDPKAISRFLEAGDYHGVLPLLAAELRRATNAGAWPQAIPAKCHERARVQAMHELAHRAEIGRVLGALAEARIASLLLKGTGLAYGCYPDAILRPRVDTDLLVSPEASDAARRILEALGYRRAIGPAGRFVGYQVALHRDAPNGARHAIDLHWRISDLQSFAWLFSFDELAAAAVAVPKLDPRALRLGNAHALLLCLLHRAGTNLFQEAGLGDRLIWLYDMKVLTEQMPDPEREDFQRMVEGKRLGAIAIDGLRACAACFDSARLRELIGRLERSPGAAHGADILCAGKLRREWIEFRAIPAARTRLVYLAERLFPARDYMREQYPEAATQSLPLLYLRRWVAGLRRLVPARGP